MDEPFGALDPVTRVDLRAELLHLQRLMGTTTLIVTHDLMEALQVADEIVVLDEAKSFNAPPLPSSCRSRRPTSLLVWSRPAPRRETVSPNSAVPDEVGTTAATPSEFLAAHVKLTAARARRSAHPDQPAARRHMREDPPRGRADPRRGQRGPNDPGLARWR